MRHIKDLDELIAVVGAGCSPMNRETIVGEYSIWGGREVIAFRYKGKNAPDAIFSEPVVLDDEVMRPVVEDLLKKKSSIIKMGEGDNLCLLMWIIIEIDSDSSQEADISLLAGHAGYSH